MRPSLVIDFPNINFRRRWPAKSIGHVGGHMRSRRAITQLHDIAFVMLCDLHDHLLVPRLLVTLSSNNMGIARDDANAALRKRIKISAASSLFQTLVSFREWLPIFAKLCLSVATISDR
jgi:hypothetical protein